MEEVSLVAGSATALVAGLLSFLSPCVLPLMPAYLSFVSGLSIDELRTDVEQDAEVRAEVRRGGGAALRGSLAFIGGFSAVFVGIGASATAIGRVLTGLRFDVFGLVLTPAHLAGAVIVVFGLHLIGVLKIPILYREQRFQAPSGAGPARAFVLGAAFAFGWTPCIGPVLAGILTIAAAQETVGHGVLLLAFYSLGLGIPFFLTALSLDRFYRVFEHVKRHFRAIEVTSGVLLIGVGVLVMSDRLIAVNSYFGFLADFVITLEESLL